MTAEEVSERYHVPMEVLKEYENWGLCGAVKEVMEDWRYGDQDLERLSLIMTLHDIGLESAEIETYMRLVLAGPETEKERLQILNKKRSQTLDEIHFREKQVEHMDYLRYKMQNKKG